MGSVGRRVKRIVRESFVLRGAQNASSGWVARRPLADVPGWLGRLHDIKVPRGMPRLPSPTPLCAANINILLALVERTRSVAGDLAECGVYRGGTLIPTGLYLKQTGMAKVVHGFDSFQGFDDSVDSEIELGGIENSEKRRGGFSDTSVQYVRDRVRRFALDDYVRIVPGYLAETLASHSETTFSFVHLDVDIYESYKLCLEFFYPRIRSGGVILLDEYNDPPWPGCNKAVDEFLAGRPERLEMIERDNHVKYFVQKV